MTQARQRRADQQEDQVASTFLTPDEVARYREQGFLVPRFRFGGGDLERLNRDVAAVLAAHPDFRSDAVVDSHMPRPEGRHPSLMPFCVRPEVLDMIESLDGPDLMLWNTTVF